MGMRRKSPTLGKTARVGHPASKAEMEVYDTWLRHAGVETGSALAFDLAAAMLLEYLLERFFEAGEGAKAV
jgi:hypothetical protein